MFDVPDQYRFMILFDSGPSNDRIIILGCNELLDGLARASVWLADGTFKIVPQIFFQLYTIHFSFGNGMNPAAVYCLLLNKITETYHRLLRELKVLIPTAAPTTILVDFERAAMNSFSAAFINASISGCYFHLNQSLLRKVNEIGLKTIYVQNDEVRIYILSMVALPFVPPNNVPEAFDILAGAKPDCEQLDELLTFFEHTYVRGRRLRCRANGPALYPIQVWNKHMADFDGVARTNNAIEEWHYGLQTLFHCHYPSLWNFLNGLKGDMAKQKQHFYR